jgi:flagellar hook-associated protein 3 FlgL
MSRVATIPMQRTLFDAIQRSQQKLSTTQVQLATGKRAQNYADLGTETVRTLSARSLVARQEAHAAVANRLQTTLSIQDAGISGVETSMMSLHHEILKAIGTGQSTGLQEAVEAAFHQFREGMNATEGNVPLFAGSQTDRPPFQPQALSDLPGLSAADAFRNDSVRASARAGDGLDVTYGVLADELGAQLFEGFKTLAESGTIGTTLTDAQRAALADAATKIDDGLNKLRSINAENGRRQGQIDSLAIRADERTLLLKDLIGRNEDADLAEVAAELVQRRTILEASYSVFSQLSGLSLINYLR